MTGLTRLIQTPTLILLMKFFCCSSIVAIFSIASASAAVNLIDQTYGVGAGSFELGPYSRNSGNAADYMRLATNSTTIIGWTVGGPDGVDWSNDGTYAYDGSRTVDLAGISHFQASSSGSISTTISTTVGLYYIITFESFILGPDPVTGILTAGDLSVEFSSIGISGTGNPTYTPFEHTFTALDSSTTIMFATFNSGGYGPVIDNVVVGPDPNVVAVPEPAGFIVPVVALCCLVLNRSRQRSPID